MPDPVDLSVERQQEELDARIAAARQPIPIGEPGECEACGGDSPRLVGGRCAPCRDRRRRP